MCTRFCTRSFFLATLVLALTSSHALATPVVPPAPTWTSTTDAATIANLVNQYLDSSVGATTSDDWLDATPAGSATNRGQSLLLPSTITGPSTGNVTINDLNDSTMAMISANDGAGDTLTNEDVYLSQFNITYSNGTDSSSFNTFCIDLFHTVTAGQTYAVTHQSDLDTAFVNGSRMAYIFENYGTGDLSSDPDQAAAVGLALWDLALNNHDPTTFVEDSDGSYSSGDPNVFSVNFNCAPVPEPRFSVMLLASMILPGAWLGSRRGRKAALARR